MEVIFTKIEDLFNYTTQTTWVINQSSFSGHLTSIIFLYFHARHKKSL